MKTKTPTTTVTVQGKSLAKIDETKFFLARFGLRNLSDTEVVRLALHALLLTPALADTMQHIVLPEDGRRGPKAASGKPRSQPTKSSPPAGE
jgi:hypothetical protein